MRVYFVRHAISVLTEKKHQLPDTPLSEVGLNQAAALARRFAFLPVDIILTSSYIRSLQTAMEIEKVKPVSIIQSDLLVERKMPSQFLGKSTDDPEILPIHQTIRDHFYYPDWHYADEENFTDLLNRVKASLELIRSQKKENVLVITHGYFLTLLVYVILFGPEEVNSESFHNFREHTEYSNTGITICDYIDNKWKLLTWNDAAHLGE